MDIIDNQIVLGYIAEPGQVYDTYNELAIKLGYPDAASRYMNGYESKSYKIRNAFNEDKQVIVLAKVFHSINSKTLLYLIKELDSDERYIIGKRGIQLIFPEQIDKIKFLDVWNKEGK